MSSVGNGVPRSRLDEFVHLFSNGQDREARDLMELLAYPNGPDGPPSPAAEVVVESSDTGEWKASVSNAFDHGRELRGPCGKG